VLILLWSYILVFYIQRSRQKRVENRLYFILITVLAIDALRTLFESIYFGAWYTSLSGLLPIEIHNFLIRPEIIIIPKLLNVGAAVIVIILLIRRWLPEEEKVRQVEEKKVQSLENIIRERRNVETKLNDLNCSLEVLVNERTQELALSVERLESLREIDRAVISSLDINMTLEIVLNQVFKRIGFDASAIFIFNDSHNLEYQSSKGFRSENNIKSINYRVGEGLIGRAVLERKVTNFHRSIDSDPVADYLVNLDGEGFISCYATPLIVKDQILGAMAIFHRKLFAPDHDSLLYLEMLAGQAAMAIDNANLFNDLRQAKIEVEVAYQATLEGWVNNLDLRDEETKGHTRRVTDIAMQVAKEMNIPKDKMVHVYRGALLHDIGKMAVPDSILKKKGPLNDEEWEIMKKHPEVAYNLLSPISYLGPALDIPYCHHEKWDGTGYPRGLAGKKIPIAARCFAIVDVWDALRSDRPYREAWTDEMTLDHIKEQSGKHFDPEVVEVFIKIVMMENCSQKVRIDFRKDE